MGIDTNPPFTNGGMGGLKTDKKIAILGLGNILLRDEGVGVHAIEALRKGYDFPENVELIDGGTMGLDLLPFIEGNEKLLVVDAVNLKEKPGTITVIMDGDIPALLSAKLSIHQIGLSDVLYALKLMDITPPKIALIGIQPENMDTGLSMSEALYMNFERLLHVIINKLTEWGVEIRPKTQQPDNKFSICHAELVPASDKAPALQDPEKSSG